jgi:hypothetical protein
VEEIQPEPQPQSVEQKIEIAFGDKAERMKQIAKCESGMRQFDSAGNTITSHTNDSGLFQINNRAWDKKALELGLDYKNSEDDNIEMAKYILEHQGINAWVCNRMI